MTGCRLQGLNRWSTAAALTLVLLLPLTLPAQFNFPQAEPANSPEVIHAQQMPRDYRAQSLLLEIEAALAAGADEYAKAAESLQELLDQPYDYFLLADYRVDKGMRTRIDELLARSPAEFRAVYDRQFNPEARKLFDQALADRSVAGLAEVVRRFGWTSTGEAALVGLANAFADQGEFDRAARVLDGHLNRRHRLPDRPDLALSAAQFWRASGDEAAAANILARLKAAHPNPISALGRQWPLFDGAGEAPRWLTQVTGVAPRPPLESAVQEWRLPRGSASGPSRAMPASPIARGAWSGTLIDGFDIDPIFPTEPGILANVQTVQDKLKGLEAKFIAENTLKQPLAPAGMPLVVGGTVIVSGPASLKAFDARTGAFRWTTVEVDGTFQTLNRLNTKTDGSLIPSRLLDAFLSQRTWINRTAANLSSDGRRVYAVVDTGMMVSPRMLPFGPMVARNAPPPRSDNRLVAFDLATEGTIRWSMGGRPSVGGVADFPPVPRDQATRADDLPAGLPGVFFLGPPLPADDVLYVLGEDRGQVKLFALSPDPAATHGEVLWSLPLLNPTTNASLLDNIPRRMGGLMPVLDKGLLVCELADGVVTAVDPTLRSVVWSHRYRPADPQPNRNLMFMQQINAGHNGEDMVVQDQMREIGWWDSLPTIAGRTVLLTPNDDNRLHALDLETGAPLWPPRERGEGLYLAGAEPDRVIVVEQRAVEAREIASWKLLWRCSLDSPGVSGRGFRQDGRLTLPLAQGELATIDLRNGQILAQSTLPNGIQSANLAAGNGQIILQTATRVCGLPALDRARQEIEATLARNPRDPDALSDRGTLRLHEGNGSEGQQDLRTAIEVRDSAATRRLLVQSLLAVLRTDYARGRVHIEEIRKLAQDPEQKFWLHLASAEGLEKAGRTAEALGEYLQIPFAPGSQELEANLSVSNERWIRGRIERLLASAGNAAELKESTRTWIETVRQKDAALAFAALQRGGLSPELARSISELPIPDGNLRAERQLEQVLWQLAARPRSDESAAAAAARLVELRLRRGKAEPVSDLLDRFETDWAQVKVRGETTGEQLLKQWQVDAAMGGALMLRPKWETAVMESDAPTEGSVESKFTPVLVRGPTRGPLDGWQFAVSPDGQTLTARDRYGFDTQLGAATGVEPGHGLFGARYVAPIGRMVVYVSVDRVLVVDSATGESVLNEPLVDNPQSQFSGQLRGRSIMPEELREGIRAPLVPGPTGAGHCGNVGQPTFDSLCYQRGNRLFCIHPATGELHWTRSELPEGCEILMDEEYVVLCAPFSPLLQIYRTADGAQVGEASVPKDVVRSRRGAEWGRHILAATVGKDEIRYRMFDPVRKADAWSRAFPPGTEWTSADGENIAFLTPEGAFEIVHFRTGETLFRTELTSIPKLDGFVVRDDGHRYGIFTWTYGNTGYREQPDKSDPRRRQILPYSLARHFESYLRTEFTGPLFVVGHDGRKIWQRDAAQYRALIVSNNCPARWPFLMVLEEKDLDTKTWTASVDVVDTRKGTTIQSQELSRLRNKEYYQWKAEALNRLSVDHSMNTFDIRFYDPSNAAEAERAKSRKPRKKPEVPKEGPPPQSEPTREI